MFGVMNSWAFLAEHPIIGWAVFLLVSAGVILVLSGGQLSATLGGMFRVFATIFTTPFDFLRDALRILRTASESERSYLGSRVFTMFRLNRIQYLGIVALCLLWLSGGITTSLLTLYPQAELSQEQELTRQLNRSQTDLAAAQQESQAAAAPDYRNTLETRRAAAQAAYQRQVQSDAAFVQGTKFSHPIINEIMNSGSADALTNFRTNNLNGFMSNCPRNYSWPRGWSDADCSEFRTFVTDLLNRRIAELTSAASLRDAESASRDADATAQAAAARVTQLNEQTDTLQRERDAVAPFSPEHLSAHIVAALVGLLSTFLAVILLVWIAAALMDFFNWLVLGMRAIEKHAERVEGATDSERDSSSGAWTR